MAVTLTVELSTAEAKIGNAVAERVLGYDSTPQQRLAWMEAQMKYAAHDILRSHYMRLAGEDFDGSWSTG